jgi:hypothetical protein
LSIVTIEINKLYFTEIRQLLVERPNDQDSSIAQWFKNQFVIEHGFICFLAVILLALIKYPTILTIEYSWYHLNFYWHREYAKHFAAGRTAWFGSSKVSLLQGQFPDRFSEHFL